jgi:hypothetical protein
MLERLEDGIEWPIPVHGQATIERDAVEPHRAVALETDPFDPAAQRQLGQHIFG